MRVMYCTARSTTQRKAATQDVLLSSLGFFVSHLTSLYHVIVAHQRQLLDCKYHIKTEQLSNSLMGNRTKLNFGKNVLVVTVR